MQITAQQTRQLQTICSKRFPDREERLEFLSQFCGEEITTAKDLTERQAHEVIRYLNTGKEPDNSFYALFDKENGQHKAVLSRAHLLGWVQADKPHLVDLKTLGTWLISNKCPVQKPLMKMTKQEVSKVIYALEQIWNWKHKNAPI